MVKVTVREHNCGAFQLVQLKIVHNGIRLTAGVDDRAIEALLVSYNVAVGLNMTERHTFYIHRETSFR